MTAKIKFTLLLTVVLMAASCDSTRMSGPAVSDEKASVFVVGDSISMYYGPYLEQYLEPDITYARKRGDSKLTKEYYFMKSDNGGTSKRVLDYLEYMFKKPEFKPGLLVVNAGLHDLAIPDKTGTHRVAIDDYEKNIKAIIELVRKNNTRMAWIRTTPVDDKIHNSKAEGFKRHNDDVIAYNAVADKLCIQNNIPIIDLYQFTLNLHIKDLYADHVHYTTPVRQLQAAYIAGCLQFIIK